MLHKEKTLRSGLFRLPEAPVGADILIPGFRSAQSVRGAFGWFTSGWIPKLAPGLAIYLNRASTAPIDFVVSPTLYPDEKSAIERAVDAMSTDKAMERIADLFVQGHIRSSALEQHALDCLSWMIATRQLQLRIAVPTETSNYHPKLWLFDDGSNQMLVRGSGNATARGIAHGVEHFDVDVTWDESNRQRVKEGIKVLDRWAQGDSEGIKEVVDISEAIKKEIIKTAPKQAPSMDDYEKALKDDGTPAWAASRAGSHIVIQRTAIGSRLQIPDRLVWENGRYSHQKEAVMAWENSGKIKRGIVSMATGAGKTITALLCATRAQDRLGESPFLVIISAPSRPLILQWQEEVEKFGGKGIAPNSEKNTTRALTRFLRGVWAEGTHVLIVTNNLLCDAGFQSTVERMITRGKKTIPVLYIADEVHSLGTEGFITNQPDFCQYRLALSATPIRQYDPDGTEKLFTFFGPLVYEFPLSKAIGFCLTPYNYYVHVGTFSVDEVKKYRDLSKAIGFASAKHGNTSEGEEKLRSLKIARRRVIENADIKMQLLKLALRHRGPDQLRQSLIYASAKDQKQFEKIKEILNSFDIRWAPVTQRETRDQHRLADIFNRFEKEEYQVLLAKKVLDEGIDIPSIHEAFIVASSTVKREWVQRCGRVLRKHSEKRLACVHDFLVVPPVEAVKKEDTHNLKGIVSMELSRALYFASHAENADGEDGVMAVLQKLRRAYWPQGESVIILQKPSECQVAPAMPYGEFQA